MSLPEAHSGLSLGTSLSSSSLHCYEIILALLHPQLLTPALNLRALLVTPTPAAAAARAAPRSRFGEERDSHLRSPVGPSCLAPVIPSSWRYAEVGNLQMKLKAAPSRPSAGRLTRLKHLNPRGAFCQTQASGSCPLHLGCISVPNSQGWQTKGPKQN